MSTTTDELIKVVLPTCSHCLRQHTVVVPESQWYQWELRHLQTGPVPSIQDVFVGLDEDAVLAIETGMSRICWTNSRR